MTRILNYVVFAIGWLSGVWLTILFWQFGGIILFPDWRTPYADPGTEQFFQIWNGMLGSVVPTIMAIALLVGLWLIFKRRMIAAYSVVLVGTWGLFGLFQLVEAWLNAQPT